LNGVTIACAAVTLACGMKADGPEPVATPPFIIPVIAFCSAAENEGEPNALGASQGVTVIVSALAG
jgi:hypothetical protein